MRSVPVCFGLEAEDLAHDPHHVLVALLRGHDLSMCSVPRMSPTRSLFLIALKAQSAAISAATRALVARLRSEALARREVDHEHHGHLALFDEHLHEGVVHARRHVPVDRAHVVARLVLAHLAEREPLPLEDGVYVPESCSLASLAV